MTTVHLDEALVAETKRQTGVEDSDCAVATGLRLLLQLNRQADAIRELQGSVQWQGDLERSRLDLNGDNPVAN